MCTPSTSVYFIFENPVLPRIAGSSIGTGFLVWDGPHFHKLVPPPQGHVIVTPNLLIFGLLPGYGCLFFGYAL